MSKNYILSREVAEKKLERMALEIAEQLSGETDPLILIGIKESGLVIAKKMIALLKPLLGIDVQVLSKVEDNSFKTEWTNGKDYDLFSR